MKSYLLIAGLFICSFINAQEKGAENQDKKIKPFGDSACNCIDSINIYNRTKTAITIDIHHCIEKEIMGYQLNNKLLSNADIKQLINSNTPKKQLNISLNTDTSSVEYKEYYYELERYLMQHCTALQNKIAVDEKQNYQSVSSIPMAMKFYNNGLAANEKKDFKKAAEEFEFAVKVDSLFAFAWDNLGLCYRRLGELDKAIYAYKKSIAIDPYGTTPLQNIAIVYQYKKEYQLAIKAYEKLAELDKSNPEVYYGIGNIYVNNLQEYENGLHQLCEAYNLYVQQKSPYRTDAEKIIAQVYSVMKEQNKEKRFREILEEHHIKFQ